ncbi:hypothetical protein PSDVSF_14800 [Pseudodesulfovibrio sediminis]|uniref:Uncharacterized protein n=1 Tax=Pseudodesulfovibrio sediminis TaxID=2810563 RepID=A0ABM7P5N3_9BACT|nr:hypothetical protein PSDVSF_14800 [Pseudodesulfovibrio sediminis]
MVDRRKRTGVEPVQVITVQYLFLINQKIQRYFSEMIRTLPCRKTLNFGQNGPKMGQMQGGRLQALGGIWATSAG